jgi:hypothetical protein
MSFTRKFKHVDIEKGVMVSHVQLNASHYTRVTVFSVVHDDMHNTYSVSPLMTKQPSSGSLTLVPINTQEVSITTLMMHLFPTITSE